MILEDGPLPAKKVGNRDLSCRTTGVACSGAGWGGTKGHSLRYARAEADRAAGRHHADSADRAG